MTKPWKYEPPPKPLTPQWARDLLHICGMVLALFIGMGIERNYHPFARVETRCPCQRDGGPACKCCACGRWGLKCGACEK